MSKQSTVKLQPAESQVLTEKPKEKIGLLGGTFNPPHIGHLVIADQVRNQLGLEEVWFVPTSTPPHKEGKTTIDGDMRVDMLLRAIQGNSYFDLNTLEIDRGGVSYTYDTIKELQDRHPDKEFFFIVGADMVQDLPNWYKIDELIEMVQFVGVNRLDYERESQYPIIWVDVPNVDISSTELRHRISQGEAVRYLIPASVVAYIVENELYQKEGD